MRRTESQSWRQQLGFHFLESNDGDWQPKDFYLMHKQQQRRHASLPSSNSEASITEAAIKPPLFPIHNVSNGKKSTKIFRWKSVSQQVRSLKLKILAWNTSIATEKQWFLFSVLFWCIVVHVTTSHLGDNVFTASELLFIACISFDKTLVVMLFSCSTLTSQGIRVWVVQNS